MGWRKDVHSVQGQDMFSVGVASMVVMGAVYFGGWDMEMECED